MDNEFRIDPEQLDPIQCAKLVLAVLKRAVLDYCDAVVYDDLPQMGALEAWFGSRWATTLANGSIRNIPREMKKRSIAFRHMALAAARDGPIARRDLFQCPICGGIVKMRFSVGVYKGKRKTAAKIRCKTCKIGLIAVTPLEPKPTLLRLTKRCEEYKDNNEE